MQQELIAGDSLRFLTTTPGYPASAGWVLKFRLASRTAGGSPIDITATAEGDDHRVAIAAGTTANWSADSYTWSSWVELSGEKYTIESQGQIIIRPDPRAMANGYDGRSQARRALDDLRAALATYSASNGTQRRYKIADREMEFSSTADIVERISYWEMELQKEDRAARLAAGLPDRRKVFVRLGRQ